MDRRDLGQAGPDAAMDGAPVEQELNSASFRSGRGKDPLRRENLDICSSAIFPTRRGN
jgi:hypothetical protein